MQMNDLFKQERVRLTAVMVANWNAYIYLFILFGGLQSK